METRIFRVTHSDGGWLNAELRTDINDGLVIIEARESFGDSVVSCEQLPDDHPAVRRHTERLIAESKGVPVSTEAPRTPCKYAPAGRFCDNAINAELLEALEAVPQVHNGLCASVSEFHKQCDCHVGKIRAALAKARGTA
ncbi:hypothetical protein [Pandoraea sputorum]|uniref:hypothetical protein n=1 Tax=Pandoraea sputorum TaxID=93222 RepID=UPI00123F2091|nr:hypothetical protein [Pandoraea sputorum]VVE79350.1 hypothetical protein PSP31120_02189 [Pandoraea sputorum]